MLTKVLLLKFSYFSLGCMKLIPSRFLWKDLHALEETAGLFIKSLVLPVFPRNLTGSFSFSED